ncbi:metalloregulator ArsR/SmtB family transcription factor [Bacillaceae bacterium IKA-2]|nr:metalloregulator ArsR/SmtB family transcription factor [Bacillaceae bacterium IKA-2]
MENIPIEKMATVLKLLGDKTRLTMLLLLKRSDCCVCEFVEIFQMSQPSISQHIRKLKDANLVTETRKGQWIFYSLNRENAFFPTIDAILNHLPNQDDKIIHLIEIGKKISCD